MFENALHRGAYIFTENKLKWNQKLLGHKIWNDIPISVRILSFRKLKANEKNQIFIILA